MVRCGKPDAVFLVYSSSKSCAVMDGNASDKRRPKERRAPPDRDMIAIAKAGRRCLHGVAKNFYTTAPCDGFPFTFMKNFSAAPRMIHVLNRAFDEPSGARQGAGLMQWQRDDGEQNEHQCVVQCAAFHKMRMILSADKIMATTSIAEAYPWREECG